MPVALGNRASWRALEKAGFLRIARATSCRTTPSTRRPTWSTASTDRRPPRSEVDHAVGVVLARQNNTYCMINTRARPAGGRRPSGDSVDTERRKALANQSVRRFVDPVDIGALAVLLAGPQEGRSRARCCRSTAIPRRRSDAAPQHDHTKRSPSEGACHDRNAVLAAAVFTVDAGTNLGHPANSSEEIAEGGAQNNDVLVPFGSVDPLTGAAAIEKAKRLVGVLRRPGVQVPPVARASTPRPAATRCTRRGPNSRCRWCSIPGRPGSVPAPAAGSVSSSATRTRSCSTWWPPTSPT